MKILLAALLLSVTVAFGQTDSTKNTETPKKKNSKTNQEQKDPKKKPTGYLDNDEASIEFVGNGNLQQAIDENADLPANTGLGVILKKKYKDKEGMFNRLHSLQLDFYITVASTVDTIETEFERKNINGTDDFEYKLKNGTNFGNYLLLPINSKKGFQFNARMNFKYKFLNALEFKCIASNRNWVYNRAEDSTGAAEQFNINVSALAIKVHYINEIIPFKMQEDFSVCVGTGIAFNGYFGDLGQVSNIAVRKFFFGENTDNNFFGYEFFASARLKNLRAEFSLTNLFTDKPGDIPGLTGIQAVYGINYVGGFPIKIKKEDN